MILQLTIPQPYYNEVNVEEGQAVLAAPTPFTTYTGRNDVIFAPDTEQIRVFADYLQKETLVGSVLDIDFVKDEAALEAQFEADPTSIYMAVVFNGDLKSGLSYTMRLSSDNVSWSLPKPDEKFSAKTVCREKDGEEIDASQVGFRYPWNCPVTSYYWSGLSSLQYAVDRAWLSWMVGANHTIFSRYANVM